MARLWNAVRYVFAGLALAAAAPAAAAPAAAAPAAADPQQLAAKPLFSSDEIIRLTISGPIAELARGGRNARTPRSAVLSLSAPSVETHPIRLSARGITRLKRDVCQFPPLRVEFDTPPATGLFSGQRRLKLVTHCRAASSFQQHLLLEYTAYRLYNRLTPASFKVRLASIDYVEGSGRPVTSRLGFFIEDHGDLAARNGLPRPVTGSSIPVAQLSGEDAARFSLFEYMIGNLDWSMRAGPDADSCCHNSRLLTRGAGSATPFVPVPYDFDFSGLVDAPYATPPEIIRVPSVRVRHYRGYCRHNAEALRLAADIRAQRPSLMSVLDEVPQLEERTRRKAAAYLGAFFADIASDSSVASKVLKNCV